MQALAPSLLTMRLSIVAFMSIWAAEKFITPERTLSIFANFYGAEGLPITAAYGAGALQVVVLALMLLGLFKTFSYGAVLAMHLVSTVASYHQLFIAPFEGVNHLFWASVPTLAAMVALFLLRREDRLLSLQR